MEALGRWARERSTITLSRLSAKSLWRLLHFGSNRWHLDYELRIFVRASMFEPKKGCPLCSIVASSSNPPSSSDSPTDPQVLYFDDIVTAYREKANPVSAKGHIIITFKYVVFTVVAVFHAKNIFSLHVPSLYTLVK